MKEWFKKIWAWIRKDGLLHIACSAIIYFVVALVMYLIGEYGGMFFVALIVTAIIGLGKEVYDSFIKGGDIEVHDLICDGIGIVLGTLLSLFILLF